MSWISGQVDRLRTAAQTYRRLGNHSAESMLLDAADTICELQAENAKLRELVRDMWGTMDLLDACGVDEYDEPLNCCTGCNQYGSVDELAGGKRAIGCKLMYRMHELGVDE